MLQNNNYIIYLHRIKNPPKGGIWKKSFLISITNDKKY